MADRNLTVVAGQGSSITVARSRLKEALAEKTDLVLGDTTEQSEYGAELRPVAWSPPDTITPDMIEEAKEQYARVSALLKPVHPEDMKRWLVNLGLLTASTMDAEQVKATIAGMCSVYRNAPAGAFNNDSLQRALELFEFFPKGKAFAGWLESERNRLNRIAEKLGAILTAGVREAPPKWSKDAAEAHAARLRAKADQDRRDLARSIKEREASAIVGGGLKPLRLVTPRIDARAEKKPAE